MKIILILVCMIAAKGRAQTLDEFFQQKKVQKKYLLQQIAALQSYTAYVEKGYSIANTGLQIIHSIKTGDFNLHRTYFNSLSAVNPAIKKYVKVASIIAMQISIAKKVHNAVKQCEQLTNSELSYLQQVFNNVLDACAKNLDELFVLITDSEQQMKDDERIKRIDKIYEDMQDKNVFVQSFGRSAKALSVQRINEGFEIQSLKKINGLQ